MPDRSHGEKLVCAAVALMYPGLILIDHGHFQYPLCVGVFVWVGMCVVKISNLVNNFIYLREGYSLFARFTIWGGEPRSGSIMNENVT